MLINKIVFTNYKQYKGVNEFVFGSQNLIQGSNGIGKSNLISGIKFVLFGYSEVNLNQLPNKEVINAVCMVTMELQYKNDNYVISRSVPSKINIIKNGQLITETDKQNYLNNIFGNIDNFKRFRTVDAKDKGVNFLEEGKTALKKILINFNQDSLNIIRTRLQNKKSEYETFNKESVLFIHYPSDKRLSRLNELIGKLESEKELAIDSINDLRCKNNLQVQNTSKITYRQNQVIQNLKQLEQTKCYTCGQELPKVNHETQIFTLKRELDDLKEKQIVIDSDNFVSSIQLNEQHANYLVNRINKCKSLIVRLEARLKQREYKYTKEDVLNAKESISELDRFYSYYIKNWISQLEPLINNIIEKINYKVKFILTEKGDLDIKLTNMIDDKNYSYDELSTGQKLILSIAFKMAILIQKGDSGLIVADEGLGSLDAENMQYVLNLFKNSPFQLIGVIHRLDNVPEGVQIISLNDYFKKPENKNE